jgi:glutathione S-transferase
MNTLLLGPNIRSHLDFLESKLGQRRWLASNQFSGADIQLITSVFLITCNHTEVFFI